MTDTPARRPVIGLTPDHDDACTKYISNHPYALAVERAGGLPLILPYRSDVSLVPQYVDLLDGMLFTGGDDLDPAAWGEARHPRAGAVDPNRERFERALLTEVEKRRMPTLGICLGCQLMNVHRGGSLHQFLPDLSRTPDLEHRLIEKDWSRRHVVNIDPDTTLQQVIGSNTVQSNSSHKQSINKVGDGLRVVARAPDGVIEGIEDDRFPLFLAVQWHPERQHDERAHLALFQLLVSRAKQFEDEKRGAAKDAKNAKNAKGER